MPEMSIGENIKAVFKQLAQTATGNGNLGIKGAKEVLENKEAKELTEAKTNENEQVEMKFAEDKTSTPRDIAILDEKPNDIYKAVPDIVILDEKPNDIYKAVPDIVILDKKPNNKETQEKFNNAIKELIEYGIENKDEILSKLKYSQLTEVITGKTNEEESAEKSTEESDTDTLGEKLKKILDLKIDNEDADKFKEKTKEVAKELIKEVKKK